jgi:three-Cys-motif partner protein
MRDARVREIVGSWVRKKHSILEQYVGRTRGVRKNWVAKGPAGATYIDLFSGPGRVRVEETKDVLHGSPLVAWKSSDFGPFTNVYVADAHDDIVKDCAPRRSCSGPCASLRRRRPIRRAHRRPIIHVVHRSSWRPPRRSRVAAPSCGTIGLGRNAPATLPAPAR